MIHFDLNIQRKNFTLDVKAQTEASAIGLFGPSGSGKTTLLAALAGLVRPNHGYFSLDTETIFDSQNRIHQPVARRGIGYVFQEHRLFPHYSTRKNLLYGMPKLPRAEKKRRLEQIAEMLGIEKLFDRPIHKLSGGQQQRVAIGRALLASPRLLLMDEPFASLDGEVKSEILIHLRRIKKELNIPMIIASHDPADLMHLCDEQILLRDGNIVCHGDFLKLTESPDALQLLRQRGLAAPLRLKVVEHRPDESVTLFALANRVEEGCSEISPPHLGSPLIRGPLCEKNPIGSYTDSLLFADDVALSRASVEAISMQNQIRCKVLRLTRNHDRTFCVLDMEGVPIVSDITHVAADELGLKIGQPTWALFKTHGLRYSGHEIVADKAASPTTFHNETISLATIFE